MSCLTPLSPIEVTNLVNDLPTQYGQISAMNLFRFKGAFTETVAIDRTSYVGGLIPISPWCCDTNVTQGSPRRELFPVEIPHTELKDALWACDISGVRAERTGLQVDYASVAEERAKVLMRMRMNFDLTLEYRMLSALKGQVLDADGSNVLLDIFSLFGATQQTQDIPLSVPGSDVLGAFREATRKSRLGARSFVPTGWRVIAGKRFFDALVGHDSLRDLWKRCCDVQSATMQDMANFSFSFMPGLSIMEYWGTVANNPATGAEVQYMGDTEAFLFPMVPAGVEMYETLAAPPKTLNFVNTSASQLLYMWEKLMKERSESDAEGIAFFGEMNALPIVKHPGAIIRLNLV
jgi:hypothetical protein